MQEASGGKVKTKDFYHAVILKTVGVHLIGLERGDRKFVNFVFDANKSEVDDVLRRYWNGELLVDPKHLIANIHELKTRLHSVEGWR